MMAKGSATAEEVLKVIEGMRGEANIQRTITVDENGWGVEISHHCYDQYTRENFWRISDQGHFQTFIEALDFAVSNE